MGQSATIYRIDKNDFLKIVENPKNFGLFKINRGYETFEKTFEGLEFVLLKNQPEINKALIKQIFNPNMYVGEIIDLSKLNIDELPDNFDFLQEPVYYNDPICVREIYDLIESISVQDFEKNFDHHELNTNKIYPYKAWNNNEEADGAFNARYMVKEFKRLKSIMKSAKENGEYLLSYVG